MEMFVAVDFVFIVVLSCLIMVKLICKCIERNQASHVYTRLNNVYTLMILCVLLWKMVIEGKDIRMIVYVEALVYGLSLHKLGPKVCPKDHSKRKAE